MSLPTSSRRRLAAPRPYTEPTPTREAFGHALVRLGQADPRMVVLDPEVGNSTHADMFGEAFPDRYLETYIAEQHTVGTAQGLSRRGFRPVTATFAAFWSRAHDQLRMAAYSDADLTIAGSHAGVSIGEDGPSQMGLEDIALFRGLPGSIVLYPSDAASAERLTELAVSHDGISYVRLTRGKTPLIYSGGEQFRVGGSKVLRRSSEDVVTIVAAGITIPEALAAADGLARTGIDVRVVDAYSIKPLDTATLNRAARETNALITVEDHYPAGGLGEAVASLLAQSPTPVHLMAVNGIAGSASPEEQLQAHNIDRTAIIRKVRSILR